MHWNPLYPRTPWDARFLQSSGRRPRALSSPGVKVHKVDMHLLVMGSLMHTPRLQSVALWVRVLLWFMQLPLSSWHLTYWSRGSRLEQTRCVVSQLQRLPLSREQVTMSQPLFYSYTGTVEPPGVVFKLTLFLFYSLFPAEDSESHDAT